MTAVTVPETLGGSGSTYSDDDNPNTGMAGGGHRTRFVPALADVVALTETAKTKAQEAYDSAASAVNAPGTSATCDDPIAIPTVFPTNVSFTLDQTYKLFIKGMTLTFSDDADPTKQFTGVLTSFLSATGVGVLKALVSSGTGTLSAWNVFIAAPIDGTLTGRVTALEAADADQAEDRFFFGGDLY